MKRPSNRKTNRRGKRLTFERCEPRLTLSGDGGFIHFDLGDYLSPAASDFVLITDSVHIDAGTTASVPRAMDSAKSLGTFQGASQGQFTGFGNGVLPEVINWHLTNGWQVKVDFEGNAGTGSQQSIENGGFLDQDIRDAVTDQVLSDSPTNTQAPALPYEPADLVSKDSSIEMESELSPAIPATGSPADAVVAEEPTLAESSSAPLSAETTVTIALPPITAQQALQSGQESAEPARADVFHDAVEFDEGGPIEVAQVVAEAQRAHESKLFAEVAARLDAQLALVHAQPPRDEPMAGELARAVVFELVGEEPTAEENSHRDDPHAALPAVADPDSGLAVTVKDEQRESDDPREMVFAQWPLFVAAALGGVLAGHRRYAKPGTTQQPPRRRDRQTAIS